MYTRSYPLHRSHEHRLVAGVCGGFAQWLGWSPTTFRILYILASVLSAAFPGILVYMILWLAMPTADRHGIFENQSLSS